ncbi:hypothetical protein [Alkalihalobacterium alkalinitrilicum]|uniref:hypothetical protein n=1 Tax=Alkalihalobacterium alkalinitrilicum TaxID=427920 RepID=UPI001C56E790|nr:hypothetical protein [Alkalihalobacterium alkalinitrilicum]
MPLQFVKNVQTIFQSSNRNCGLRIRAQIAYRSAKFPAQTSIDRFIPSNDRPYIQTKRLSV